MWRRVVFKLKGGEATVSSNGGSVAGVIDVIDRSSGSAPDPECEIMAETPEEELWVSGGRNARTRNCGQNS